MSVAGHHMPIWFDEATGPTNGQGVFWNATTGRFESAAVDISALDTAGLATDAALTAGLATKQNTIPPGTYVQPVAIAKVAGVGGTERSVIQTALDVARDADGGLVVVPYIGIGESVLDAPLVIHSGTHLKLDPRVRIRNAAGNNNNMIQNAAAFTTAVGVLDGAVTSGSAAVTSAGFTVPKVGQPFTIWGAGPNNGPATGTVTGAGTGTLDSRVDSCTTSSSSPTVTDAAVTLADQGKAVAGTNIPANAYVGLVLEGVSWEIMVAGVRTNASGTGATSVTLGGAARTTVSGGYVAIGPRDSDITIEGGIWDYTLGGGAGGDDFLMRLRRVDNIKVKGLTVIEDQFGKQMIDLADVKNYVVEDIYGHGNSNPITVGGPAFDGRVANVRGWSGDDFLAFNIGHYPGYEETYGPIDNVQVDGVLLENRSGGIAIQGDHAVFSHSRISIANVSGSVKSTAARVVNDTFMTATRVSGLTLSHINCTNDNYPAPIISVNAVVTDLRIEDFVHNAVSGAVGIAIGTAVVMKSLVIDGIRNVNGVTTAVVYVEGAVDDISIRDVDVIFGTTGKLVWLVGTSVVKTLSINGFRLRGSAANKGTIVYQNAGSGALRLFLSNGYATLLEQGVQCLATMTAYVNSVVFESITGLEFHVNNAAAVLRVLAGVVDQPTANHILVTAGAASVNGRTYKVNKSLLTPVAQDEVFDTVTGTVQRWSGSAWAAA